jgi:hypothetical protein
LSNEMQNVLQVSDADPRSVGVKEKKNRTPVSAVRHVVYECRTPTLVGYRDRPNRRGFRAS